MRCLSCDCENLAGDDFCDNCGMDLAGLDVKAWGVGTDDPLLNLPLSALPMKEAVTLRPTATVLEAVGMLNERGEGCAFVTGDDDELLGVFTERDVMVRVVGRRRAPSDIRVSEVMTPDPFLLRREDVVAFALNRMGVGGFRHLPIVDAGNKLQGFISARTILRALAEHSDGD